MGGEAQGAGKARAWVATFGALRPLDVQLSPSHTGDLPCWEPPELCWEPPKPCWLPGPDCPPVLWLRLRAEPMCSVRVMWWLFTLLIKTVFSVVHSWAFFFFPSPFSTFGAWPWSLCCAPGCLLSSVAVLHLCDEAKGKDHGIVGVGVAAPKKWNL